ncbi:hypothetical protein TNCV_814941 [Trichonephila clavipes]|nr:hypothetical protein TNCV_814941 [Trichonephila clavipes]
MNRCHASAYNQRGFGCILGVQQPIRLPHIAEIDFVLQRVVNLRRALEHCVPSMVAHYPERIRLMTSAECMRGPRTPTPQRCSAGCLVCNDLPLGKPPPHLMDLNLRKDKIDDPD